MTITHKDRQRTLDQLVEKIQLHAALIGRDHMEELRSLRGSFTSDAQAARDENRLLRIGFVGGIKRGKSSLLNALFFNGQDILPKAVTPMTAALTAIKYAEKPRVIIDYFAEHDWEIIKQAAQMYDECMADDRRQFEITEEMESAAEIVRNAQKIENIASYLGSRRELDNIHTVDDLKGRMGEYVGADGLLAPLVKSSEIYINTPSLQGVEMVDTPGLNDPVISRAAVTKEYLGKCDVVFFLSSCAHFISRPDIEVLMRNIPSKGIKNIVLIGSRFDDVLVETNHEKDSTDYYSHSKAQKKEFNGQALKVVEELEDNGVSDIILKTFKQALPPIFISAMAYSLAIKADSLNEDEQFYLGQLNDLYPDFTFDKADLLQLANLEPIGHKLQEFRRSKDEILKSRYTDLIRANEESLHHLLSQKMLPKVKNDYENFKAGDFNAVACQYSGIVKELKKAQIKIDALFNAHAIQAEKDFSDLTNEIKRAAIDARRITSAERTETHSYEKGWWIFKKTVQHTETHEFANVHTAVEQLEMFVVDSEANISDKMKVIIDINKFRAELLQTIKDLFPLDDDSFNPMDILLPAENAVNRLTIPHVNLDVAKHIQSVRKNFKGREVRDDKISELRSAQADIVRLILGDINQEVGQIIENLKQKLDESKNEFIPELTKDINEQVESLRKQLEDKEKSTVAFEAAINTLQTAITSG